MHAIRAIVFMTALIGFIFQVITVLQQYFKYETRTQVHVQIPENVVHHNVSFCISYIELLDAKRLEEETGIKWKKHVTNYSDLFLDRLVTIDQVFKYTPEAGDAIESCIVRTNDWMFHPLLAKNCSKSFNVSKFLTLDFMCYRIQPLNHLKMKLRYVTQSMFLQFVMFEMELGRRFAVAEFVNVIVYTGSYPFISRDFSSLTTLKTAPGAANKTHNYLNVYSSDFSIKQLPAPFDTGCRNRSADDQFTCQYDCLLRRYQSSTIMPFNIIIPDRLNHRILGYKDLLNPDILALVSKNDRECEKECFFTPCLQQYTKTTIDPVYFDGWVLGLGMRSPIDPDIETESVPVMKFVEMFCFLCSCLGTWFGVSFLSMDPFQYAMFQAKKRRTKKSKQAVIGDSQPAAGNAFA